MKDLYPKMFVVVVDKKARIFYMIDFAPNGGGRTGTYFSVMNFKTGRQRSFRISLRISPPSYLGGVMIP